MARQIAQPIAAIPWLDYWASWRDRLLASARFRQWAVSFPLTRPIARRRTRALFDLCSGFVYTQVLLACVRLRLFDILAEGPQPIALLAGRVALPMEATRTLLAAAVSLRLVAPRGKDRFGLGALGAAMVDNPAVAAMVEHHTLLYADLQDPVALLRGEPADTNLNRYWAYARTDRPGGVTLEQVASYSALMAVSQSLIASEMLDAYPVHRHRCLMDVGGGDGTFLVAAAKRARQLRLTLLDLPPVAERARDRFAACGLDERLSAVGGDFFADPLPNGADLITLIRVLHDHDDDAALVLLRAIRAALPPDGTLLIAEPMSGTAGAEPISDAYFGFYLLAMRSGRPRTPKEIRQLLLTAGFSKMRSIATRTPLLVQILVAQ